MEYLHQHPYDGADFELFAGISAKNHFNSTMNPLAAIQKDMSVEQIMAEPMIAYPNTRAMCSANSDGAAAAVVVSGEKLRTLSKEQQKRAVKVSASVLTSDPYQEACQILPDVNTLTRIAAKQAYELAGVGPDDLDLVELHDCFATAELVHYDNLMLCSEGDAVDFFLSGATTRDGKTPVNVSGGLESKGHPIAATGIANIWEICYHLRGEAGARQIEGAKVGDVLKVEVLAIAPRVPYGVVSSRHGKGALPGEFPETAQPEADASAASSEKFHNVSVFTPIRKAKNGHWEGIMHNKKGAEVVFPAIPFMGVMGVAPASTGAARYCLANKCFRLPTYGQSLRTV
jgi:hypothetical protein